jgi:hypothetical protein
MVSGRLTASHHRAALVSAATGAASALALAGTGALGIARRRPRLLRHKRRKSSARVDFYASPCLPSCGTASITATGSGCSCLTRG